MKGRPRTEMQFGSDSFLDVIANVVGILVVLIVIAGVRVSHAPPTLSLPQAVAAPEPEIEVDEPGLPVLFAADQIEPEPAPPRPVAIPAAELVNKAGALRRQIDQLATEQQSLDQQLQAERQVAGRLAEESAQLKTQLEVVAQRLKARAVEQDAAAEKLASSRVELSALVKQLRLQEAEPAAVQTLEHYVNPITRVVEGSERHFRLAAGRVSEVPIQKLTNRLREQIERRKEWLMKLDRHQGEVSAVDGYSLTYLIERGGSSLIDELQYGGGGVRIAVTKWVIEPSSDLVTESPDEAMQTGSRFTAALLQARDGAALTFWVYPDSFGEYRKLQRFAHEHGFLVAARPLPAGIPIMGSPNGSKSTAQ